MAVKNSLSNQQSKPNFAQFMKNDKVQNSIVKTLGSEAKKNTFVSSISSAVSTNTSLQECDFNTIVNSALLGESLNLSPSPQLGYYYMVPFNDRKNKRMVATFQLGYKGYIQLAIRSGQYKKLNVLPIKEGELVKYDPLEETIEINLIPDEVERENAETVGYYAMFELVNGFKKTLYWSKAKMVAHAEKYSAGYRAHKGYTFWEKEFDAMACKTMIRQLLSKWGIMSIELQTAYTNDMTFKEENKEPEYFDNVSFNDDSIVENVTESDEPIQEATTQEYIQPELL